jgi:hypothetical protein
LTEPTEVQPAPSTGSSVKVRRNSELAPCLRVTFVGREPFFVIESDTDVLDPAPPAALGAKKASEG